MARPTKFTPETIEKLLRAIRMGDPYRLACMHAGIHFDTFNEWRKGNLPRRPKGLSDVEKEEFDQLKSEFPDLLMRAEGDASVRALSTIQQAMAQGNADIALKFLERRWPEEFGMKRVEVTGKGGGPVEINNIQKYVNDLAPQVAAEMGIEEYGEDLVKTVMDRIKGEDQDGGKT